MLDLKTFFEEKQIDFTIWEIEHNKITHHIDSDCVIEAILSTQGKERETIAKTISILDFKDASMTDYLKFMAEALIKNQFKD